MSEPLTTEEVFAKINAAGYRIHNLFQFDDFWQCNLREWGGYCHEFVQAKSVREVLEKALKLALTKPLSAKQPMQELEDFSDL